jgi:DNA modification methylase
VNDLACMNQASGEAWTLINGDAAEVMPQLPEKSVDFSIFSPPFLNVYAYSASDRDLGNVRNAEAFWEQFRFISHELLRMMRPGRLVAIHVANLPTYESRDGFAGLSDFRGDTIRHFQSAGFVYHSEICIQKNPQAQAIRHHPRGLLFVQLERDASWMRQALADYVVVMRTPGDNPRPIVSDLSHEEWIAWAHPIWTDIRETDVLPVLAAKESEDERHLCPLQLPVIERCVRLWTARGETVFSPFAGVGSDGVPAVKLGRRFVGIELKPAYWKVGAANLRTAELESQQVDLFALAGVSV